jgi:hypothetical protein
MRRGSRRSVRWSRDVAQVEKLLARLSNRVSELTQVTAQGDNSALCAQLLVSPSPHHGQPSSAHVMQPSLHT